MKLYIKQRIFALGDKYDIMDENGNAYIHVESEIFSFGAKIRLYDMNGNELFYIEQKLFRFLPKYEIYKNNTLCASLRKEFTFFSPRLTIDSDYGQFEIKGDLLGMDFDILAGNNFIGSISKEWFRLSDCYELNIADTADDAFFCALTIAIDNCLHNGKG